MRTIVNAILSKLGISSILAILMGLMIAATDHDMIGYAVAAVLIVAGILFLAQLVCIAILGYLRHGLEPTLTVVEPYNL